MTAHITEAEARRLGIIVPSKRRPRTTRKTAKGPYHTRCKTCAEEFHTEKSEEAHLISQHHARYELVLS